MIDINLHGRLRTLLPDGASPLRLDVKTPAEAVRALCVLVEGFAAVLRDGHFCLEAGREVLTLDTLGLAFGQAQTLHIVPVAAGAGPAWLVPLVLSGLSLLVTVIALTSVPRVGDYTQREPPESRPSYLFDGAVNTHAQGGVVPLIFGGPIRVGSTLVSAGITAERHIPTRPVIDKSRIGVPPSSTTGAGGGKKTETYVPREGPNTLQTNATLRVVDLIGEGEMRGPVNGLKSVFIDGVQVQNDDGSFNIEGVSMDYRAGLPDQTPLSGMPAVESERTVERQVEHATPIVQAITNPAADSARVTLRFPRLSATNEQGDTLATGVRFKIAVQPDGGSYTTHVDQTLTDKNISPAELSWRVPLTGDAPWNVRVTRVTADSDSDQLHNDTWWARLTEVSEVRQTYPYSAVVGITARADEAVARITRREYEVYGLIVDVPSNYNATTRVYTGLWDGTFKRAWTDNPAWCIYTVLTERRFGLGGEIPATFLSATKWELYAIAQFCDARVADGQGGSEPRFRFTGIVNTAAEAKKLLDNLLSNFRATLYYGGGAVVPVQDAPADASALLTNANVIDGAFRYADLPVGERFSAVAMSFNDPADGYKLGIELVVDDTLVQRYGYRQTDRVAMFCTSRAQAHRLAKHLLFEQEHASDTLRYATALEHAHVRPGDVIKQSDTRTAGVRAYGRIAAYAAATRTLTLDHLDATLDTSLAWTAHVVLPDGAVDEARVTAFNGDTVTLATALSEAPLTFAVCVLEAPQLAPRLWRVVSVTERDDLEFTFTARACHPGQYATVERGLHLTTPNISLIPTGPLAAPTVVQLAEYLYQDGVVVRAALTLAVTGGAEPRPTYTEFELQGPDDADYRPVAYTRARSVDHKPIRTGRHQARARFVDTLGVLHSPWTVSPPFNALGKTAKPSTPKNLQITVRPDSGLALTIDPIPDLDRDHYSYWHGDTFEGATLLARVQSTEYLWTTPTAGTHTLWVQAHDTSDAINSGSTPASIAVTLRAPGQPAVTLTYEGDQLVLTWNDVQTDLRIAAYEVSYGATVLAEVTATTWRQRVTWTGARTLTVRARDIAGNRGAAASVEVHPTPPARPQITARVIDNTALFNYTATPGSLPVERFEVRRGDVFTHAPVIAVKAGTSTFTVLAELAGGTYTYGWSAIDTAGNRSPAASVSAVVTQPPDYALLASYSAKADGWPGTTENACLTHDGNLLLPIVTDDTWERHFTDEGWTSPNDQIAAGFPHYMQPSAPSGTYQDTIDYGAELTQALVTVSVSPEVITGTLERTVTIAYSADNRTWTEAEAAQVLASQFRYVRYTVALASTGRDDLATLNDIRLTLDVKLITDAGQATADAADANGTWVAFNKTFIDAVQPTVTPAGNQPRFGVTDFADEPHPTGFYAYLFDTDGHRVSGAFGWSATGFGYNT